MHAISSYRGNRPTNTPTNTQTHTQTNKTTDRTDYNNTALLSLDRSVMMRLFKLPRRFTFAYFICFQISATEMTRNGFLGGLLINGESGYDACNKSKEHHFEYLVN